MPYRNKTYGRRRRRRRPITYGQIGSKVYSDVLALKKLINVEYKSLTTALVVDPNGTGSTASMCPIPQGDDFDDRNGRKIRLKSVRIRGSIEAHASATNTRLRLVLVRDNNGSTTQPAITDLFATASVMQGGKNKLGDPQSNARFSVLWDQMFVVTTGNFNSLIHFDKYLELDSHVYFSGTGATDEGKGCLYLMAASNEGTNDPVLTADCQIKWIDN